MTELLFIRSYRGGNKTQAMYEEVFPFNQYTVINIEVKTTFLYGSSYNVSTTAYMRDSYYVDGILRLIGDKDSLIKLEENSFAVKKLNPNNGVLQINFSGTASINHVSTKIIVDVSTNPSNGPIDIPFDGTWLFTLEKNAKVTVNSHIAFLPGSGLVMEEGSEMIISKDGRVTILNDDMIWNSGDTYPTSAAVFYRTNPTFSFNKTSNINLDLNGKIIVESGGGISGKIESELFLEYGSVVNYDYKYVTEFTGILFKANYSTFPVSLKATHLDIDKFNNNVTIYRALNENNKDTLYLTETLLDWNNNPIVNAEVEIYHEEIGTMIKTTDEKGKVVFEVPFNNNWKFKEKVTYKFTVNYENVTYSYPYVFENVPLIVDVSQNEFEDLDNTASEIYFDITIIETFTGNPLVNHEINLEIKDSPTWLTISNDGPIKTDLEGKVKITISILEKNQGKNARSAVVNININYDGFDEILKVNISQKAGQSSGSPYIYSTDKDGNLNLENGPISLSVLKTIESSSYGTLKLLESIDGKYYIQVIEDGTSTTMFNSANLYAVDYLDDGFVLGVLYDIYGEPHTIKEKILPNSFVDENGTSYLDEITTMDGTFAILPNSNSQLSHFYLTFDRNEMNDIAKFMISIRNKGSLLNTLESMGDINIEGFSDLWLLDALLMSDPNNIDIVNNVVKAFEIKVQLWNGSEWITQGTLQPSSKLTEEFLIPIDLINIFGDQVKLRIEMPTHSGYGIDSVAMDFKENALMIKHELTPISALTQDGRDVLDIITISNDEYVKLLAYEYVMLEYNEPELLPGYARGYGFRMQGYAYKGLDLKTDDDILEQFIGLDFNQIIDVVYNSNREDLLEHIDMIAEFAQTLIYMGTLEQENLIELFLYLGNNN